MVLFLLFHKWESYMKMRPFSLIELEYILCISTTSSHSEIIIHILEPLHLPNAKCCSKSLEPNQSTGWEEGRGTDAGHVLIFPINCCHRVKDLRGNTGSTGKVYISFPESKLVPLKNLFFSKP